MRNTVRQTTIDRESCEKCDLIQFQSKMSLKSSNRKSEYIIKDVTKAPLYQLHEMLDRQKKLLANSKALAKLPDKGDKIRAYELALLNELERRNQEEMDLSKAMAGLELSSNDVQNLEWLKKGEERKVEPNCHGVEEDDHNPFKMMASHSGAGFHKKEIIIEEPEPSTLITPEDIEPFAVDLSNKVDKVHPTSKFLPHRTLLHAKEPGLKQRDLSSATPPLPKFGDTKLVSLSDSIKLQFAQAKQLKQIQLTHAAERLKQKGWPVGDTLPEVTTGYRDVPEITSEDDEPDDDENHGSFVTYSTNFDEVD